MHIITTTFHGASLYGVDRPDGVYVALKPIAESIGLDWEGQRQRVHRDAILSEGACIMQVPFTRGGEQDALCLRLDLLNGWLFTIDVRRVRNDGKRERILTYQRECYRALAAHFAPPPKVDAISPPDGTAAAEPLHIRRSLVTEARQTHGTAAARELWFSLGLPTVPAMVAPGQADLFGGRAHA